MNSVVIYLSIDGVKRPDFRQHLYINGQVMIEYSSDTKRPDTESKEAWQRGDDKRRIDSRAAARHASQITGV